LLPRGRPDLAPDLELRWAAAWRDIVRLGFLEPGGVGAQPVKFWGAKPCQKQLLLVPRLQFPGAEVRAVVAVVAADDGALGVVFLMVHLEAAAMRTRQPARSGDAPGLAAV